MIPKITIFKPIVSSFSMLMKMNIKFRTGFIILSILVALACISFLAPPSSTYWYSYPRNMPPSFENIDVLLGTTANGRSVFWAFTHAIKNSLIIGIITALVSSHIGLMLGIIAGLKGGAIDKVLMFITDSIIVIPPFIIYMIVIMTLKQYISALGNPIPFIGLIFSITGWCWPARQVRAIMLSLREREFVLISILSGNSITHIMIKEAMPHLLAWHLTNLTNAILYGISMEAGLAVLGLSILDKDTLGTMIYWVLYYSALFRGLWWWYITPILGAIMVFAAFFLISQGISEYINPRLR